MMKAKPSFIFLTTLIVVLFALTCPAFGKNPEIFADYEDPSSGTTEGTTTVGPCAHCDDPNTICVATCECKAGYHSYYSKEGECSKPSVLSCHLPVKNFHSGCIVDAQCQEGIGNHSKCIKNYCRCTSGYVQVRKGYWENEVSSCEKERDLGQLCVDDEQCRAIGQASCSENSVCSCYYNYVPDNSKTKCVQKASRIGARCNLGNEICSDLKNSECAGGELKVCECKENFVRNQKGDQCLPAIRELNVECKETNECLGEGKTCAHSENVDMTTCQCLPSHVQHQENCLPIRSKVDDFCDQDSQCTSGPLGPQAECREICEYENCGNKMCNCKTDTILGSDGRCHPIVTKLGGQCDTHEQCVIGKKSDLLKKYGCDFNFTTGHLHCQCLPGYVQYGETTCHPRRYFGDMCLSDDECKASIDEKAKCDGICDCSQGFVISADGRSCLKGDLEAGTECEESIQCMRMQVEARSDEDDDEENKGGICDRSTNTCVGYA